MKIHARLKHLNTFSDDEECLTRLTLSPAHKRAYGYVKGLFEAAGLTVTTDGLGSLIGRKQGLSNQTLIIGSHIDTVKNAGTYDGNLGVLAGLELIEMLKQPLGISLEIHAFGDEEGVRFPTTLSNSRALTGVYDPKILDDKDENGITRRDALKAFYGQNMPIIAQKRDDIIGYLEVHIEQGPVLEAENLSLGVVTAINGATRGRVTLKGLAGHAGTVPMALRQDALTAASEMLLAIENYAKNTPQLVATVGVLEIKNAAVNVIAQDVSFTLDMRSNSDEVREKAKTQLANIMQNIATKRQVEAEIAFTYNAKASPSNTRLMNYLSSALAHNGLPEKRLASGAGHDAMAMNGVYPAAMLFVRSKAGLSHHPDEFSSENDIEKAVHTLHSAVLALSQTN